MAVEPTFKLIYSTVGLLLALYYKRWEDLDREKSFPDEPIDVVLPVIKEYDFIVVGSGTAGSVVANRLSEKYEILLIEIGGDPLPPTKVPALWPMYQGAKESAHVWYSAKQNKSAQGHNNGHVYLSQGKAIGGSSTINSGVYNRGSPHDWDNFAEMTEDPSWSYENMIEHFKKIEDFADESDADNEQLGKGGNMYLIPNSKYMSNYENEIANKIFQGGNEIGYETYENSNGPQKEGFVGYHVIKKNGLRFSAFDGFIKPILNRKTLTIVRYSEAKKIEIDEEGRAIGVFYTRHGIEQYSKARKEIIVSAGTLNSPLLLMRSGIGPVEQLKEAGIEVKADLPVGQFYQDHPYIVLNQFQIDEEPYKNGGQNLVDDFLEKGLGPFANIHGIIGQAFLTSSIAKEEHPDKNWPDTFLSFDINSKTVKLGDNAIQVVFGLGRGESRGTVKLDLSDPHNKPVIWDPNQMTEEKDIKIMIEGCKISEKLIDSESFKKIGGKIVNPVWPNCADHEYASEEYWRCFVIDSMRVAWHPAGTCRMGAKGDEKATVDSKLKVIGIKGLRVADNSIQPEITNANTMSPALVIGQKAASMILNDAENESSNID